MYIEEQKEIVFINDLKNTIHKIVDDGLDETTIGSEWLSNVDRLCHRILNSDPKDFLQWDVISRTMVVGNAEFVRDELNFLMDLPDWKTRWENAIKESAVGNPTFYDEFPSSSGNLIHQAYHLAQFEKKTGMDISDAGLVFEFGGGYGSLCRLIHNLNFKGRYVIFDISTLSALQHYFLNMNGIESIYASEYFEKASKGVICVSEFKQVEAILADYMNISDALFVATWSLSEAPINLRQSILSLITSFMGFLIAFQGCFGKIDNKAFFEEWTNTMKNIEWHSWKIMHLPNQFYKDNFYLMGKKIY